MLVPWDMSAHGWIHVHVYMMEQKAISDTAAQLQLLSVEYMFWLGKYTSKSRANRVIGLKHATFEAITYHTTNAISE